MTDLAQWLMGLIGPLATRVLASLGMGVLTFTGLDAALTSALDAAKSAIGGLPLDVALIVARFGFFDFMAITSGGLLSGLVWMQLKRLAVISAVAS